MLIALVGPGRESALAAVRAELERLDAPHVVIDQRAVLETEFELTVSDTVAGSVCVGGRRTDLAEVSALYLRTHDARQVRAVARAGPGSDAWRHAATVEAMVWTWAELTDALVLNRPRAMATNESKPYQAAWATRHGFHVPDTLLTTDPDAARAFWERHGEVIYKSVSGIRSRVARLGPEHGGRLDDVASGPTQLQQYVAGTDVRVHVVGAETFACEVRCTADDYRYPDGHDVALVACTLPPEVDARCRRLAEDLELPFAGIDLRRTPDGDWYCFEVNPSPGFTYYEAATGLPIARAVARLLAEGCVTSHRT
jgi:glutathione synthase/RimK-type ligase-like ATP-grasp enzyme